MASPAGQVETLALPREMFTIVNTSLTVTGPIPLHWPTQTGPTVAVEVTVALGNAVDVGVAVLLAVAVCVAVEVSLGVAVSVDVGVRVGVDV